MCDYSLHHVASRPARLSDELVSSGFPGSYTRGFASLDDPKTAVCLAPGTEIAFEGEVKYHAVLGVFWRKNRSRVARFRQVDLEQPDRHHDALEFADGTVALLDTLKPGQRAVILQLPATSVADDLRIRAIPSGERTALSPSRG